jgi:hypothetical protein
MLTKPKAEKTSRLMSFPQIALDSLNHLLLYCGRRTVVTVRGRDHQDSIAY